MRRFGRVHLNLEDNIIISLFILYVIMKPFYFWSSGLPQPADFVFVILIFMVLLRVDVGSVFSFLMEQKIFLFSLSFVLWIFFINSVWTIILNIPRMMFPTVFYLYNVIVFTTVLILARRYGQFLIKVFFTAVVLSVSIQFFLFLVAGGYAGGRGTANFNNPNQLGYYGLLALVSVFYVQSRIHIHKMLFLFATVASFILVLVSLSKAAIVSAFMLVPLYILHQLGNVRNRLFIITVTVLILITAIFIIGFDLVEISDNPLLDAVNRRLLSIGHDSDDSLEGRGYDRIFDHPEYWIFGAGEGAFHRYAGPLGGEFHSTLGNIQVSYGLIGTVLFLSIVLYVLKPNNYADWYLIFTILVYGLTHNGMRNTLFWILLACLMFKAR
jgi:hypothetical protein